MATNTDKQAKQQYTYCKVRFSSSRFELSYITEDESIRAGDFVKVPFGRENEERVGLVTQVISCTSEDAPYPPEKTKHVLEKIEQPEGWDAPKQKKTPERAEPQAELQMHAETQVRAESQEPQARAEAPESQSEPQARFEPRKKKGIGGKCIAFALAVMLVFIIGAIKHGENTDSVQPAPPQTSYIDPEREEEIMEQVLKEHYSGEMPIEGMPMRALKYTSLGEPDEKVLCRDYDKMDENHKQVTVRWYRKDGSLLASGLCFQLKNEKQLILHSFTYFDPKDDVVTDSGKDNKPTIPWEGIREDYDNPEDLWEDNPEDYDDEDEAWDEWYDDGEEPYDG